ncbi:MAG: ATP-binding cassette domain-containing protein [Bacteroidetes bacterium]|nr:MAG: ATP-binding cassette domain-containing protein [Bacteroidota bacterium]MBL1145884.1 ATP-binding cassette domain-containing protein [Bacteroidota bacterium]NOG58678.1 ATP-binding cassette domain-containing protein [Bacteroidota bacterium]
MAKFGRKKDKEDNSPRKKITKASLKKSIRLFRYVKPYRVTFAIGLIFLFLSSIASMVFPYLTGQLIDAANNTFIDKINEIALILLGIFFLNGIFSYFRIYLFAIVTQKTLASLRQETYNHLIHLKMTFFSERRVGELNSRISADIALLQETLTTTIAEFIRQLIIIIIGVFLLSYISVKLTLLMLSIVPVIVIVAVIFGKKIKGLSKDAQEKVAESNVIVEETLQGIATVKAFVNEAFENLRYKRKTDEVIEVSIHGAKWRGAFAAFLIFCLFGSIIIVIWYGVILVQEGSLSMGSLFTFILYSVFVGASLGGIADLYSQLQKAIGATENLLEILDEEIEETDENKANIPVEKGIIEFKNVSFAYPNRADIPVLNQVSFEAREGSQVAVIGPSGAGKTTITALLLKFYDAQSGQILIDGRAISEYPINKLRNSMAIVPQDVLLFGGSIYENIAYGKPEASKEEIYAAAEKANATEFIMGFPEKYETIVGERGVQLSGGQRQRIAIARAILKNPKILILDEATSSLDSKSEQLVQDALDKLMAGRTSIVIAHRLSTIQKADQILVLKDGQVVETGTHEELNQTGGLYQELKALQS